MGGRSARTQPSPRVEGAEPRERQLSIVGRLLPQEPEASNGTVSLGAAARDNPRGRLQVERRSGRVDARHPVGDELAVVFGAVFPAGLAGQPTSAVAADPRVLAGAGGWGTLGAAGEVSAVTGGPRRSWPALGAGAGCARRPRGGSLPPRPCRARPSRPGVEAYGSAYPRRHRRNCFPDRHSSSAGPDRLLKTRQRGRLAKQKSRRKGVHERKEPGTGPIRHEIAEIVAPDRF